MGGVRLRMMNKLEDAYTYLMKGLVVGPQGGDISNSQDEEDDNTDLIGLAALFAIPADNNDDHNDDDVVVEEAEEAEEAEEVEEGLTGTSPYILPPSPMIINPDHSIACELFCLTILHAAEPDIVRIISILLFLVIALRLRMTALSKTIILSYAVHRDLRPSDSWTAIFLMYQFLGYAACVDWKAFRRTIWDDHGDADGAVDGTINGTADGTVDGEVDGDVDGAVHGEVDGEVDGGISVTVNINVDDDDVHVDVDVDDDSDGGAPLHVDMELDRGIADDGTWVSLDEDEAEPVDQASPMLATWVRV